MFVVIGLLNANVILSEKTADFSLLIIMLMNIMFWFDFMPGYTKVCSHPHPPTTTRNHPQPATTSHNQQQPATTTQNHPQPSTTTHNCLQPTTTNHSHPKITQKTQNLSQAVTLLHLDVNTETEVDFDSEMKQNIYI